MPEVVEVCLTAQFLNKKFCGKLLTNIKIIGGRYSRHKMHGLDEFIENKPFIINKVDSKGKFLWFEITDKNNKNFFILNRFGLEGEWGLEKNKHSNVLFEIKNTNKDKLYDLYFTDSRNFGTLSITKNVNDLNKELNKLAPDFLKQEFTNNDFHERIKKYLGNSNSRKNQLIIKALMDQKALGSGLGNYLSVEILMDAKISPYTKLSVIYRDKNLSDRLARSIRYITKLSYMTAEVGYLEHLDKSLYKFIKKQRQEINDGKKPEFSYHPNIKLEKNDKFIFKVYRQKTDPQGNEVKADKIIKGRTTYWVPTVQK